MHEFILNQFQVLWQEYDEARAKIPAGNLVEVSYADLSKQPVETLASIYSTLGIDGYEERMRARVAAANTTRTVRNRVMDFIGNPRCG